MNNGEPLGDHVEETLRLSGRLQEDHERDGTLLLRATRVTVDFVGQPLVLGALLLSSGIWMAINALIARCGYPPPDPPPFQWLELVASLGALCLTVLILTRQRWDDRLAQRRGQMILELAILSEQRLAKLTEMLGEHRRDNPLMPDKVDPSAEAMETPMDPHRLNEAARKRQGKDDG